MRAGDYEILEPIATGAMGAVYRAARLDTREQVALKRLLEERNVRRFEIEARLLSSLEHPRVVGVREHFEHGGDLWLVMELVDGPSLYDLLGERGDPGLPVDEAVEYARQMCEALAYVHAQYVVHRDVKPENAILGSDGVVLVDFGVAREFESGTEGTAVIGTPGFMAPEVLGGVVSPRCDVFGVAATLWTLIAGEPPRYGEDAMLPVEPHLAAALRGGLELDPNRRTGSAEAFATAIGTRLTPAQGVSLANSLDEPGMPRTLLEAILRAAVGVFEAAAASLALLDGATGELVYEASWGAAGEVLGLRLPPGMGVAGVVAATGEGVAVPDCRSDERFATDWAARTGYVPSTMLTVPLRRGQRTLGVLQLLDRRDGRGYGPGDVERAAAFADLALMGIEVEVTGRETVVP